MPKILRFNASVTIQIEDTNQLSDYLRAIVMEALPKPASDPKILLNSREAAKLLNISEKTLWTYYNSGRILKPIRIGTSVRWNAHELRRWADAGCPSHEEWLKMKEKWMK
jgi:predicted DNA-binding transcriptional regulator AlpA